MPFNLPIDDEYIKLIHHNNRVKNDGAQDYWNVHYFETHERSGTPNRCHSIWLGSEFPPPIVAYLGESTWENNIKSLKKFNPDYNHVLWMDKNDFEKLSLEKQESTKKFCYDSHISLVCFQDVFNNPDEIEQKLLEIYHLKHMEGNYGGASDIMRIMLLRKFYGLYYDTDDRILKKFTENVFSHTRIQNYGRSNDIISAPRSKEKGDPIDQEFDNLCFKLIENHKKKFSELFDTPMASGNTAYPSIDYSKNYLTIPYFYIRRNHTIIGTGPRVIVQKDMGSKLPDSYFFAMSAETWLGRAAKGKEWSYIDGDNKITSIPKWNEFTLPQQTSINDMQNLLRDLIVYYHSLESRTIRFDFYKKDIMKVYFDTDINLEHSIFQELMQNSSMQLNQVEYIPFNLLDTFAKNYKFLFDKKIFYSLKIEMYLPEISKLIQTNAEAKEFFSQSEYREMYEKAQLLRQTLENDSELKRNICNKVPYISQINELLNELFKSDFTLDKLAQFNRLFSEDLLLAQTLDNLRDTFAKDKVLMLEPSVTTDILKKEDAISIIKELAQSKVFLGVYGSKGGRDYNLPNLELFVSNNIISINTDPNLKAYIQNSCLMDEQILSYALIEGHYHLVELLFDTTVKPVPSTMYLSPTELAKVLAAPQLPLAIKHHLITTISTDFEWQNSILNSGNQVLIKILGENQVKIDESMILKYSSSKLEGIKTRLSYSLMNAFAAISESEVRTYLRESLGRIYLSSLLTSDDPEVELVNTLKNMDYSLNNQPTHALAFGLYLIHQAYYMNEQIFTLKICKKLYESYLNRLSDYLLESGKSMDLDWTPSEKKDELTIILQTLSDTKSLSSLFDLKAIEHERLLQSANMFKIVSLNLQDYISASQAISKSDITNIKPSNIGFFSESKAKDIEPAVAAGYYEIFLGFVESDIEKKIIIYSIFLNKNMSQLSQQISNELGFNSLSEAINFMHKAIISDYNAILASDNSDSDEQIKEKSNEFEKVLHEHFIKPVIASINKGKNPEIDLEYTEDYMPSFELLQELLSLEYQAQRLIQ